MQELTKFNVDILAMESNLIGSLLSRAKVEENSLQSFFIQNLVCDKVYCPLIKKVLKGFTFPKKEGLQFDHNSCTLARTSDFPMCALLFSAPTLPINSHLLVIAVARFSLCLCTCQAISIHLRNKACIAKGPGCLKSVGSNSLYQSLQ